MRCFIIVSGGTVKLKSRVGRWITTMKHIEEDFKDVDEGVYDGELYAHGKSFQENMELIKKYRAGESEEVKFHCYDMVHDESYANRTILREVALDGLKTVEMVPSYIIKDETELKACHSKFIEQGYEGTIVRHGNQGYKINSRTSTLLKYKDFQDIALPILDILPCKTRTNWGEPVFHWKGAKGHRLGDDVLGAGMRFSHEQREDFLANKSKYIGKTAEVRFLSIQILEFQDSQ